MHRTLARRNIMLILSETHARQALRMKDCLEANRQALISLASGTSIVPQRLGIPYHDGDQTTTTTTTTTTTALTSNSSSNAAGGDDAEDWTLFKPAAMMTGADVPHQQPATTLLMGCKIVSIRGQNPARHDLPTVPASIMNLDAATGQVNAVLAGTYLTAARTAAGSALATAYRFGVPSPNNNSSHNKKQQSSSSSSSVRRRQGRRTLEHLVVFGAGLQAELHVKAIATALKPLQETIPRVTIINRTAPRAVALQQKLLEQYGSSSRNISSTATTGDDDEDDGIVLEVVETAVLDDALAVSTALSTASCIVTATNTTTPVLSNGALLPAGCHINGIGSYTPDMQEVAASVVDRCRLGGGNNNNNNNNIWIDTPEAAAVGDLKHLNPPFQLLGDLLQRQQQEEEESPDGADGNNNDTASDSDCTFYKAVGTAIQDVLTANVVVERAQELGIGVHVDMS